VIAWALDAERRGFEAAKFELTFSGPYAHKGLREPNDRTTEVTVMVSAVRSPRPWILLLPL
jgi:hypothetical protein